MAIFGKSTSDNCSSVTFLSSEETCRGIREPARSTPANSFRMNNQYCFTIADKVSVQRDRFRELLHEVSVISTTGQPVDRTNVFGTAAFFYVSIKVDAFVAQNINWVKIAENIRFRQNNEL